MPPAQSYWTDTNHNGGKEEVANPAAGDGWWSTDSDGDLLTNEQEVQFGSDPYSLDSDRDGLTDYVEYIYSQDALDVGTTLPYDPWKWDSNNNGFSDFDEYYQQINGYQPVINYNDLQGGGTWSPGTFFSYSDADGDGIINPEDNDPVNMDRDGDGIYNWNEQAGYMDDPQNGNTQPSPSETDPGVYIGGNWYPSGTQDSDNDGIPDQMDPFPWGSFFYEETEYAGSFVDSDGDGIPDPADVYPGDPTNGTGYYYNGTWYYNAVWSDRDADGVPDPFDSWPDDPTNGTGYNYNGVWYSGPWADADGDGIPDPADPYPNDANNGIASDPGYYYNGVWYSGTWQDSDGDGIPDTLDSYPFDPNNGSYYYNGNWYSGSWTDSDGDGIPDPADNYPYDPSNGNQGYSYNGIWYSGSWMDSDNDGIPDQADSYPNDANNGGYTYNGNWYLGTWSDTDNDGIPDPADSYPNDPNNNSGFWWGGAWYYGYWTDSDSDGVPDAADAYPNDANNGGYYYASTWYSGPWSDADSDGIPDPADAYPFDNNNGGYTYNAAWYPGPWTDYDNDGIPDPADNYVADPENGTDNDYDGLTNYDERTQFGTDPNKVDTDGDGLTDFEEIYTWHTNPMQEKTNANQVYTDYYLVDQTDTDGDNIPDRIEQWYASQGYGMNMSDPNDGAGDLDGDGYSNLEAYRNGWNLVADLDHYDGDSDGIPDVLEDAWNAKYPGILSKTEPKDAVQDYEGDGLMNFEEIGLGLDPGNSHSFGVNISDRQYWIWCICTGVRSSNFVQPELTYNCSLLPEWLDAADDDHDGVQNGLQALAGALSADSSLITLPPRVLSVDCDGDGMPDVWEYKYRLNLRYDDSHNNADWDSLNNLEEYQQGRNPLVYDDPPQFTNTPDDGTVGVEYHWGIGIFSPMARSADDVTFAITEGSLPSGLSLNSARWCVEGLPRMMGSSSFTLKATDNNGQSVSQTFTINIQQGALQIVAASTLPDGVVNTPYSAEIDVLGGTSPYQFSIADGELPDGLALDVESGRITGTPSGQTPRSFTIQVTDNDGQSVAGAYTILIYPAGTILVGGHLPPPLVVTTSNANMNAVVGVPFSVTLTAAGGGSSNYTFSVSNMGTLPAGLSFASDGKTIQGTPTAAGTCSFNATVHLGAKSATASLLLTVSEPLAFTTPSALPDVVRPKEYSQQIQISGGYGQKTLSQSGTLPQGMHWSASGLLAGRPTTSGTYTFSVTASDSASHSISQNFTMTVLDPVLPVQPPGGFQIPTDVFNAAARVWANLPMQPAGSSIYDFDGDGIPNDQEYRMSLADSANYPLDKALIDSSDWDGDGLSNSEETNQSGLSPLNFADAMQDADSDGLVNYDEIKLLAAGYSTDYSSPTSIRDSHQVPHPDSSATTPDFLLPFDCPLTDGQILRWRRDIDRNDFIPGAPGGDLTDGTTTTHTAPTYPKPAPDTYHEWGDADGNSLPDGYELWLAQLPTASNDNTPASSDVDGDGIPNLWEHAYRLAFYDAANAGDASRWLIPQHLQIRSSFSDADYATLHGTIPNFDDLLRWNETIMAYEASQDPDKDTSSNAREYLTNTNPQLADSDGDGYCDNAEITVATDPNDYSDSPKKYPLTLTIISGDRQSGNVGATLPIALKVRADRNGIPCGGERLSFISDKANFSSGHINPLVVQTAADGSASVTCNISDAASSGAFTIEVSGDGASATFRQTAVVSSTTVADSGSGGASNGAQPTGGPIIKISSRFKYMYAGYSDTTQNGKQTTYFGGWAGRDIENPFVAPSFGPTPSIYPVTTQKSDDSEAVISAFEGADFAPPIWNTYQTNGTANNVIYSGNFYHKFDGKAGKTGSEVALYQYAKEYQIKAESASETTSTAAAPVEVNLLVVVKEMPAGQSAYQTTATGVLTLSTATSRCSAAVADYCKIDGSKVAVGPGLPSGQNTYRKIEVYPVEVMQHPLSATSGAGAPPSSSGSIRFCRWLDAYDQNGQRDDQFADKDRDRFQIRIPSIIPNLTKIKIKATDLHGAVIGGGYQEKTTDGDYEVGMKQENGAMVSEAILLVSDGDDDVTFNGKGTDNKPNDQTLLADFGSKINVTFPEFGNAEATFQAQQPTGVVTLEMVYCYPKNDEDPPPADLPADMIPLMEIQARKMREIYRQVGIKVDGFSIGMVGFPTAWVQADSAGNNAGDLNYLETKALQQLVGSSGTTKIRVGFVNAIMTGPSGAKRIGVTASWATVNNGGFVDPCLVSVNDIGRKVLNCLAHEVGHALTLEHDGKLAHHLMFADPVWSNNSTAPKRFTPTEIDDIHTKSQYYVPLPP